MIALAGLAALAAACLPAGDPPAGRQLLTGRDTELLGVLQARSGDATLRFLTLRPRGDVRDLYLISVADGDAAPAEQLLVENWALTFCGGRLCIPADSRGRLYAFSNEHVQNGIHDITRIDPITGERLELGRAGDMLLSPARERVALRRGTSAGTTDLVEADDSITTLPAQSFGSFVGEDFFFQNGDVAHTLWRVPPAAPPEVVATDVLSYGPIYLPDGPLVVTFPASGDPATGGGPLRFLDPVTHEERLPAIPSAYRVISLSPNARWALLYSADLSDHRKVALLEVATGVEEPFELPASVSETRWRPGHDEVWIQQVAGAPEVPEFGPTLIKRPGLPLEATPVAAADDSAGIVSWFTRDGQYWFSRGPLQTGSNVQIFVGNADDPAAPRYPLNAEGTEITLYGQRTDGRLLIQVSYLTYYRNDIFLVDPTDGATRLLGKDGQYLAGGERRLVANLRFTNESGDLTVIDIDSGASTVLATEFAQDAVVEPGADGRRVEPGARIVFHFRARFESPYDGIWVTTLP